MRIFMKFMWRSMRKKVLLLLFLFCIQESWAQWGEEWLYCPSGFKLDYTYATIYGGQETFPLGFGFTYIESFWEDYLGVSVGTTFGGNWKKPHFSYSKDQLEYDLVSKFYWMSSVGLESGIIGIQVGLGLCAVEYSASKPTEYTSDGVYVTQKDYHKTAFFMAEPSVCFNIPIIEGYKIPLKVGYQFVPSAPIMNGLVIGCGIRFVYD